MKRVPFQACHHEAVADLLGDVLADCPHDSDMDGIMRALRNRFSAHFATDNSDFDAAQFKQDANGAYGEDLE